MQYKDAAYHILADSDKPLHYSEITERALARGILTPSGQTPHATMGALLYTDTLKPNSRFQRGDVKGTFTLRSTPPSDIQKQINAIDERVRKTMVNRLLKMEPRKFENLIQLLLDEMGLDKTSVTTYSGDGGIDIRGVLNAENLSQISIAVQAKRWKANVGPKVVRELRGSLMVHEHGIVITPSDFTTTAKVEAEEAGKTRISLINGAELVELLIKHQVGVKNEEYVVPVLDKEFWEEIVGEEATDQEEQGIKGVTRLIKFPVNIQARHKGEVYQAELLDIDGRVRYERIIYQTPTAAAKAVVEWKTVNGWDFWKYHSPENGKWVKIGELKKL
jgi:restriction system protein